MRVQVRKLIIPDCYQIIETKNLTTPCGYISQEIYEASRELGLSEDDAAYMVHLYNTDLLFWRTGYYAEMRNISRKAWRTLRERFEVRE